MAESEPRVFEGLELEPADVRWLQSAPPGRREAVITAADVASARERAVQVAPGVFAAVLHPGPLRLPDGAWTEGPLIAVWGASRPG